MTLPCWQTVRLTQAEADWLDELLRTHGAPLRDPPRRVPLAPAGVQIKPIADGREAARRLGLGEEP